MKRRRKERAQLKKDLAALAEDRKRTRFLLDANVEDAAVSFLASKGYDVMKVARPGLDDAEVWKIAQQMGRLLVTHDADFWSDRFPLARSPGAAIVGTVTAEAVVGVVSFLRQWPTFWAGTKIRFVAEDRLHVKLRAHSSGAIEVTTLVYRNATWEEETP